MPAPPASSPPTSTNPRRRHSPDGTGRIPHTVRFSHAHSPSDIVSTEWPTTSHLPPPWELVDEKRNWINETDVAAFEQALRAPASGEFSASTSPALMPKSTTTTSRKRRRPLLFWARAPPSDASEPRLPDRSIAGITFALFRLPLLLVVLCIMAFELGCYVWVRQIVNFWEYFHTWRGKKYQIRQRLRTAPNYEIWRKTAEELDLHIGRDAWKRDPRDPVYDWKLIQRITNKLKHYAESKDIQSVRDVLAQGGVKGNCGGVENRRLYSVTYYGTKDMIETYLKTVTHNLEQVSNHPDLHHRERFKFFKLATKNYGRTALCLSGGAANGYYHLGVIRELLHLNVLPRIVTGTSAGSYIAAIICVRTDAELKDLLRPERLDGHFTPCFEPWMPWLERIFSEGAIFGGADAARQAMWGTLGSTTFKEAYERTGRILNIPAVPLGTSLAPTKMLNYITAPDVVIWSAMLASSSIPGVLNPVVLMRKRPDTGKLEPFWASGSRWRDGSFRSDIPIDSLKHQVNPHVTLFFYDSRGTVGRPSAHLHGRGLRGGFLLATMEHFLKLDLAKYLRLLRDLELLPRPMNQDYSQLFLQRFHGSVTVRPRFRVYAITRLLADPDLERLHWYMDDGARSVWGAIHMLENRLMLERAIRRGLNKARRDMLMAMDTSDTTLRARATSLMDVDGMVPDTVNGTTTLSPSVQMLRLAELTGDSSGGDGKPLQLGGDDDTAGEDDSSLSDEFDSHLVS